MLCSTGLEVLIEPKMFQSTHINIKPENVCNCLKNKGKLFQSRRTILKC